MPRPSREVVAEIRAKRGQVLADVRGLSPWQELERRIREAPGPWLIGGVLAGLVSGRFLAAPAVRRGRGRVGGFVRAQVKQGLVTLALAALGRPTADAADHGADTPLPRPDEAPSPPSTSTPTC
jgi:hypothetical protein